MRNLKTVGVKELKNHLSEYLRQVRGGARILVSDRNLVVAELREPLSDLRPAESSDPILSQWIAEGIVVPPSATKAPLPRSPVRLKRGSSLELLDEDRRDKRS